MVDIEKELRHNAISYSTMSHTAVRSLNTLLVFFLSPI